MVRQRHARRANGRVQSYFRNGRARFAANESREIIPAERNKGGGRICRPRAAPRQNHFRVWNPLKTRNETGPRRRHQDTLSSRVSAVLSFRAQSRSLIFNKKIVRDLSTFARQDKVAGRRLIVLFYLVWCISWACSVLNDDAKNN